MANRHETWNLLRSLNSGSSLPWVVGGDFNEILDTQEKTRAQRAIRQMEDFHATLDDCGLQNLGFSRYQFT